MIPEEMQSPDMKEAKAGKVSKELKLMPQNESASKKKRPFDYEE